MKIKKVFILLILFANNIFSQKITVCDSVSKRPISFANVVSGNEGAYTDLNGQAEITKIFSKISISHINYDTKKVKYDSALDTVFMNPRTTILDEVIISNTISEKIKIGFLEKDKRISSIPIKPKNEMLIKVIPDIKYFDYSIYKITIPLNKIKHYNKKDKLYKNTEAIFRLNIYIQNDENTLRKIYQSSDIGFIMSEKESISIDLKNEKIELHENGIYIGIEMIGKMNKDGEFTEEESYIRPLITSKVSNDYESNTYLKSPFNNNIKDMTNINKFNEHFSKDLKKYNPNILNLAIGLTLYKP